MKHKHHKNPSPHGHHSTHDGGTGPIRRLSPPKSSGHDPLMGHKKHDGHKQAGMGLGTGYGPAEHYDGAGHGDCAADEANVAHED